MSQNLIPGPRRKPISALELSGWLAGMVLAGFIITGGLFVNSMLSVRLGDPTLPYLLAGVGYPALVVLTALFAIRFLRPCEALPAPASQPQPAFQQLGLQTNWQN